MTSSNQIRLYNTLSREIEDFVPVEEGKVKLYACGPTVYDYTHLGHIRKYIFDDVLVRMLRYLNFEVKHVMNITDVGHLVSDADTGEDKLEKGAQREGKTAWEVAKFYEEYFLRTMDKVGVNRPDVICRATDHIKEQILLVQELEKNGFTYKIDDGIYFDSTKFSDYGKLSGIDPAKQKSGARVEAVPGKKHATDFALWKFTLSGSKRDMEWESPWGRGFPGWHIECSAMSLKYLTDAFDSQNTFQPEKSQTIDVHTGGIDHIPIHHPNEIAQSQAVTGKKFVNYWVHHNFLLVDNTKMSKSLKNFYTLDDVVKKGFDPMSLRYLFLQTHYRQEANFTWEALTGAQTAFSNLRSIVVVLQQQVQQGERLMLSDEKLEKVNNFRKRFKDVLRMDLNTAQALAVMWEIVKSNIPSNDKLDLLMLIDDILGLGLKNLGGKSITEKIPQQIQQLVVKREQLRSEKKFSESDDVRKQIEAQGYVIEDSSSGTQIRKKI